MPENMELPGGVLALSAAAAGRLIRAGSGDAALLYLYLLKSAGAYQGADAAKRLGWERKRADAALSLLEQMGLAQRPAAPQDLREPEPPEYTGADIAREMEDGGSPFPLLVDAVQQRMGKVLSTSDLKSLYTIYDFSGLPAEVILLAVNWCVEEYQRKNGPGRVPRMPMVQREAMRWKEQGVDTVEAAEAHLRRLTRLRERSAQVLALMDIHDRPPVEKEREYIDGWLEMGFGDEAIRLAYEKTVTKKGSRSLAYMNAILLGWHQKGLHTVAQINASDARPRRAAAPGAGATAPQPGAPGEADRRAEANMERLMEQFQKEKEEGNVDGL